LPHAVAMNGSPLSEHDIVAWLILGYLSRHPDAKDTAEGVEKWWLSAKGIDVDAKAVRISLEYLVRLGWLVSSQRMGTGMVFGLNGDRRNKLREFLESTSALR
jgi:hypothetical protein